MRELDDLDLFNVAEIRRPKDGMIEIKFYDRLRALEKWPACRSKRAAKRYRFIKRWSLEHALWRIAGRVIARNDKTVLSLFPKAAARPYLVV